MNVFFCFTITTAALVSLQAAFAAGPSAEDILKPTRLSLVTAGSDLARVFAEIEKQTGNKLEDETRDDDDKSELPEWNFSMSDREFWPLLDRFLDAANLEPIGRSSGGGLRIGRRPLALTARYGRAVYVGPFRLEVTEISSRLVPRIPTYRSEICLAVAWEPRLRPLSFVQAVGGLQMVADTNTPVTIGEGPRELSVEVSRDDYAAELHIPIELLPKQLESISSLKGHIKALVATRVAEFRFDNLNKAEGVEKVDGGLTVELVAVRENQGLCELGMRLEFEDSLPPHVGQGSWNFQNNTYLEDAAGERIDHAGFETTSQSERKLGLAYYFDVPEGKLGDYTWVYEAPVGIVEVPIEFELKDIPLP